MLLKHTQKQKKKLKKFFIALNAFTYLAATATAGAAALSVATQFVTTPPARVAV